MYRTQTQREVVRMEEELALLERWRDEAPGDEERAEIVAGYRANLQELRDAVRRLEAFKDRRLARLQEHHPTPGPPGARCSRSAAVGGCRRGRCSVGRIPYDAPSPILPGRRGSAYVRKEGGALHKTQRRSRSARFLMQNGASSYK